ncbi:MAG: hypothetical protein ACI9AV_002640 [Sediminicola sp.]|jgi:hypothetical protein
MIYHIKNVMANALMLCSCNIQNATKVSNFFFENDFTPYMCVIFTGL